MLKRLDIDKYRSLIIYRDGTWKFGKTHSGICTEYMEERGFYPENKHVAGFFEVTELREISVVVYLDEAACQSVTESRDFINNLRTI